MGSPFEESGKRKRRRRRSASLAQSAAGHSHAPRHASSPPSATIARVSLVALTVVVPWVAFALRPSIVTWLYLGLGVCWCAWFISWRAGPQSNFRTPWAAAPLVAGIALGLFQLVPWPDAVYPWAAPGGSALEAQVLAPLPEGAPAESQQPAVAAAWPRTISLAPGETRRELTLLILGAAAFLLAARFLHHKSGFFWLCVALAVNSAALAMFGIVQQLTWKGQLFWSLPIHEMAFPFSAWQNKNNAGGFLNMGLGAALGLLVWSLDRAGDPPGHIAVEDATPLQRHLQRYAELLRWRFASIDGLQLAALALNVMLLAGLVICGSRGAIVGLGATALVVTAIASILRRKATPILLAVVLALPAAGLFYWLGQNEAIQRRLGMAYARTGGKDAMRLEHWSESLGAAAHFKLAGTGLGTYRLAYPPLVDHAYRVGRYDRAENQYVEAALTGGAPGLACLLAALGLTGWAAWRLLAGSIRTPERGPVLAAVYILVSQAICALFDFGLYQPPNMLVLAVVCGAICGRAAHELPGTSTLDRFRWLETARAWAPAVLAALCVWGVRESWLIRNVEAPGLQLDIEWDAHRRRLAHLQEADPQGLSDAQAELAGWLDEACERLSAGLAGRPDDVRRALQLAEYYQARYGLDPPEFVQKSGAPPEQQRQVNLLFAFAHQRLNAGDAETVAAWRELPTIQRNLLPALQWLETAARASPLEPRVFVGLAQLDFLTPGRQGEWACLEIARRLARSDQGALYEAGVLEFYAGRPDRAWVDWKRSLTVSSQYESTILQFAVSQLPPEQVVERVLPPSREMLLRVAAQWYRQPEQRAARELLMERAAKLRYDATHSPAEHLYLAARVKLLNGQTGDAVTTWQRAIELDPAQLGWRYELATELRKTDPAEALALARECLRRDPRNESYSRLVNELVAARKEEQMILPAKAATKDEAPAPKTFDPQSLLESKPLDMPAE